MASHFELIKEDCLCGTCHKFPLTRRSFQCRNGHLICRSCAPKTPSCSRCGSPAAEALVHEIVDQILDQIRIPCVFQGNGCGHVDEREKLVEHLEVCRFKTVSFVKKSFQEESGP